MTMDFALLCLFLISGSVFGYSSFRNRGIKNYGEKELENQLNNHVEIHRRTTQILECRHDRI